MAVVVPITNMVSYICYHLLMLTSARQYICTLERILVVLHFPLLDCGASVGTYATVAVIVTYVFLSYIQWLLKKFFYCISRELTQIHCTSNLLPYLPVERFVAIYSIFFAAMVLVLTWIKTASIMRVFRTAKIKLSTSLVYLLLRDGKASSLLCCHIHSSQLSRHIILSVSTA